MVQPDRKLGAHFLRAAASSASCCGVELHGIHDADDRGVDGAILALGGQARGAAGNDQHGFAKSGVHGIDGNQVAGFVGAFGEMGFTMSSFLPSRRGSLRVETTVPTMRARIIQFSKSKSACDSKTESGEDDSAFVRASTVRFAALRCATSRRPSEFCRWAARLRATDAAAG